MTTFSLSLTHDQLVEFCKRQARQATKALLFMAIATLCVFALFLVVHFLVIECMGAVITFLVLSLFAWLMIIFTRRAAPKNAENMFKYYAVDGVVTYGYELCETDIVVTLPAIGNVSHYKYDMIQRVNEYGEYVVVMLANNQFLPIIANETTAQLISTLKSVAKIKK